MLTASKSADLSSVSLNGSLRSPDDDVVTIDTRVSALTYALARAEGEEAELVIKAARAKLELVIRAAHEKTAAARKLADDTHLRIGLAQASAELVHREVEKARREQIRIEVVIASANDKIEQLIEEEARAAEKKKMNFLPS